MERYHERLAPWREAHPATGFSNAIPAERALRILTTAATYVPLNVVVVKCRTCGACVPGAKSFGKSEVTHACNRSEKELCTCAQA